MPCAFPLSKSWNHSIACPLIYIYRFSTPSDIMPQLPGTGTTHHSLGVKVKPYVKMGPCYIVHGCCRTKIQCRVPESKGWIYMNRDRCIKCEQRAEVSFGIVAWWMKHRRADFRATASQEENQRGRRWEESKTRTRVRKNPCTSLAD